MRHPFRTVAVTIAAVVLLSGCTTAHRFQLLLTVRNADTGEPLQGVTGVFATSRFEVQQMDFDYGQPIAASTAADGQLAHEFTISPYPSDDPYWYLKLKKEGFEPVAINIKPNPQPQCSNETSPLPVTVEMKPLSKKP